MTIKFFSRKVRLGREYYVDAVMADGTHHRIGSFKFRARADDWIRLHAADWQPEQAARRTAPPASHPAAPGS